MLGEDEVAALELCSFFSGETQQELPAMYFIQVQSACAAQIRPSLIHIAVLALEKVPLGQYRSSDDCEAVPPQRIIMPVSR
jgi:hypothetical protein